LCLFESPLRPAPGTAKIETVAKVRGTLVAGANTDTADVDEDVAGAHAHPCPCCRGRMIIAAAQPVTLSLDLSWYAALAASSSSSHAAPVRAMKLINPVDKCDRGTTGAQVVTHTGAATNKSP
jgi:hypothetical protein